MEAPSRPLSSEDCPSSSSSSSSSSTAAAVAAKKKKEKNPVRVSHASELSREGSKLQVQVQGRYLTVFNVRGKLHCMDAVCYHAGGPLTVGDIEEVGGRACVRCPWHNYFVTVDTGEKLYQSLVRPADGGKMVPGKWESIGVRQRIHEVFMENEQVYVVLNEEGKCESDKYARDPACGKRLVQGEMHMRGNNNHRSNRPVPFNVGQRTKGHMIGADGKLPFFKRN